MSRNPKQRSELIRELVALLRAQRCDMDRQALEGECEWLVSILLPLMTTAGIAHMIQDMTGTNDDAVAAEAVSFASAVAWAADCEMLGDKVDGTIYKIIFKPEHFDLSAEIMIYHDKTVVVLHGRNDTVAEEFPTWRKAIRYAGDYIVSVVAARRRGALQVLEDANGD